MASKSRGAMATEVLTDSSQVKKMSAVHQPLNLSHSEKSRPGQIKSHNLSIKGHTVQQVNLRFFYVHSCKAEHVLHT